jgi:hypothetical protein
MEDSYSNIAVHALKDAERGVMQFFLEIEGGLVPLIEQKLGNVQHFIDATAAGDLPAPPSASGEPAQDNPAIPPQQS